MENRNVVDGYFVGNLGDDLFLRVLAERFPNTQFEIQTSEKMFEFYEGFGDFVKYKSPIQKKLLRFFPAWLMSRMFKATHEKYNTSLLPTFWILSQVTLVDVCSHGVEDSGFVPSHW